MKRYFSLLFVIILCFGLTACGNPKTTNSAENYIGMDYVAVIDELDKAGFTNIETKEIQDITSESKLQDGEVTEISIDGNSEFDANTEFESDVLVVITYHTIKKLGIPISSDDVDGYDSESIATLFGNQGFENVTINEVYDLDPDTCESEFLLEVLVNGKTDFDKNTLVAYDAEVEIICHRAYEKYTVKVEVDFISNLLFNKYDVVMELNGEEVKLKHGEDDEHEFRVKEGEYTLSFVNDESSSVSGEVELEVNCDVDASFKISCQSDEVEVETIFIDNKKELADDEVKVMSTKSSFKGKNYKDVIETLEEWGFTNIKEKPKYDIVWGITDEGTVENVKIDGTDDYKRGDVFNKDVKVVVSYHLKEADDPSKQTETNSNTDSSADKIEIKPNITIENNTDFASLMKITNQTDATTIKAFVNAYKGETIEFDGCIALMMQHDNYKTRFDVCMAGWNYDADRVYGPLFTFEDVNYYDMNVSGTDTVAQGMNFRITAKIIGFSDAGTSIILEPVALKLR